MDHFEYKNNSLYAEDVSIRDIADQVGTPFYCYSTATLKRHYEVFADGFKDVNATICFAVKSNSNLSVLKTLANLGSGGDCVSEGEIRRCLAAGIPASKIVFSGVGKTKDEMAYALSQEIMQFNIESEPELEALNEVAISMGRKAPIAFRVNPHVDAGTHEKISTGRKQDKFGIDWNNIRDMYNKASSMNGIKIQGIATHIGSQLTSLAPLRNAFTKIEGLVKTLRKDGHKIKTLDLGGGLGIPYNGEQPPSPIEYAEMAIEVVRHLGCDLIFEPGRLICGNAGILVTKAIYLKRTENKNFLVVDAAMNDLIRPALYDAVHNVVPVNKKDGKNMQIDVVGPICETGDILSKNQSLAEPSSGDLIAIRSAGAYGAVMSCEYNSRLMIPEVLVNGDKFSVIRHRNSYEEMLSKDVLADWL